jgi:hypothetical protein
MTEEKKRRALRLLDDHAQAQPLPPVKKPRHKSIATVQVKGDLHIISHDNSQQHNHYYAAIATKTAAEHEAEKQAQHAEILRLKEAVFVLQNQTNINVKKRSSLGEK